MDTADIKLPGVHNIENYMAAIAAVDGMVTDEAIRDFARTFGGVEHPDRAGPGAGRRPVV